MIEIERKFLVINFPNIGINLKTLKKNKIVQGYISTLADKTQVRLRNINNESYFLTIKTKTSHDLQRVETETQLTASQFQRLWPTVERRTITKTRYYIPHGSYNLELDLYGGKLMGLVTVEAEFQSLDEAKTFIPPSWVEKEISTDSSYGNPHLAVLGLPSNFKGSSRRTAF